MSRRWIAEITIACSAPTCGWSCCCKPPARLLEFHGRRSLPLLLPVACVLLLVVQASVLFFSLSRAHSLLSSKIATILADVSSLVVAEAFLVGVRIRIRGTLAFPVAFLFALPCLRPFTKDPSLPFSFLRRAVRCPLSCRNQLDCIV